MTSRSIAAATLLAACSPDDLQLDASVDPDAGIASRDARVIAEPIPPEAPRIVEADLAPEPAALPVLTPCPPGWREVTTSSVTVCDPFPESGRASCAPDQAHFAGEAGCATIGLACDPSDDFAPGLGGVGVVYVRSGATPGGDGSRAAPLAAIAEGIAASAPLGVVALSKGTFTEPVRLPSDLELRGACVAETVLTGTVTVEGLGADLMNLSMEGGGLVIEAGATSRAEGISISATRGAGVTVRRSARLTMVSSAVRDTGGHGVDARGELMLSRGEVTRSHGVGVLVAGAAAAIEDVVIDEALPDATGQLGYGIQVSDGAITTLERSVIERHTSIAAFVSNGVATISDVIVRDGRGGTLRQLGSGVNVFDGGRASLARVLIDHNVYLGVGAGGGATADLSDVVVRDTDAHPGQGLGIGVLVEGAAITGSRVLSHGNRESGLYMLRTASATLRDLTVRETAGPAIILEGSSIDLERSQIANNREDGVFISQGSEATISDLHVRGTASVEIATGFAVTVSNAVATIQRSLVENNREGILVENGDLTLEDARVRENGGGPAGAHGGGLVSVYASHVVVRRVVFEENTDHGIYTYGADPGVEPTATLSLEDVIVRDTRRNSLDRFGVGSAAAGQAMFGATRLALERNSAYGLVVFESTADVSDLAVIDTMPQTLEGEDQTGNRQRISFNGIGLALANSEVTLTRARVERSVLTGVISLAGSLSTTDLLIADTRPNGVDRAGFGLWIADGRAQIQRGRIERSTAIGVLAEGEGTDVTLMDVLARDTARDDCNDANCFNHQAAIGVAAVGSAHVSMHGFRVERNETVGVQVATGGTMDLEQGVVSENPIGANVQTEGFDVERLSRDVEYRDNVVDLDATAQPIPNTEPIVF